MRQTFFCDAHRASHDLEPADNGRLQALGRRLHFLQHAVNAKPDAEFFIERLQMNVARARAMRLDQQHRHQANNRCFDFIHAHGIGAITDFQAQIDIFSNSLLEDIGSFIRRAVIFDQRLANFLRARANQFQLALK